MDFHIEGATLRIVDLGISVRKLDGFVFRDLEIPGCGVYAYGVLGSGDLG